MKTAIIIAGATRQTHLTYKYWDKLPQGDLYYSTWSKYSWTYNSLELLDATDKIKQLSEKVNFKTIYISDYETEYLGVAINPFYRPFILLEKVYNSIKNQGYERVIYFRPDIKLFYLDNYNADTDFDVNDKLVKVLGDYTPDAFWIPALRKMNDLFFVFSWKNFELFINNRDFICSRDIHDTLFEFFESWRICVKPIETMRSVILRYNIDESNVHLGQIELQMLFLEVFEKYKT